MKLVSGSLTIIAALTLLAGCSADSQKSTMTKSNDTTELFQKKSIAAVGLNHKLSLTFDDGPSEVTESLLDYLHQEGIQATFFLNGKHIPGREHILRRMYEEGHIVANHSQHHNHLPRMVKDLGVKGWDGLRKEIDQTHVLIKDYVAPGGRLYFRAPHGAWQPNFADFLNQDSELSQYIGPVFWDIGGEISLNTDGSVRSAADWDCWDKTSASDEQLSVDECAAGYLNEADRRNGGIVLMHDKTHETVEMVKRLVPEWRARGYAFKTLDEVSSLERFR